MGMEAGWEGEVLLELIHRQVVLRGADSWNWQEDAFFSNSEVINISLSIQTTGWGIWGGEKPGIGGGRVGKDKVHAFRVENSWSFFSF